MMAYCNDNKPENVAFVSKNYKDFANNEKTTIHEYLAEDVQKFSSRLNLFFYEKYFTHNE
jgi:hypothetical protein